MLTCCKVLLISTMRFSRSTVPSSGESAATDRCSAVSAVSSSCAGSAAALLCGRPPLEEGTL